MSAAHKNESPVSAGQFVKTLSKYAADFIAFCKRIAMPDGFLISVLCLLIVLAIVKIVRAV